MKKLAVLLVIATATATFASAQQKTFYNPSNTDFRTDTVINAGTTYLKANVQTVGPLGLEILCSKVSGTVGGTCYLEASYDPSESTTSYVIVDSLVLANQATNSVNKSYAMNTAPKYRWRIVTSGTQAFIVRSWFNK